jgi:hypothetical protein
MNILVLDIETTPFQSWGFNQWQANIYPNQVTKVPEVMCFAWKWHGDRRMNFEAGRYHPDNTTDYGMAAAAHELMSEADGIVTFNGDKFDNPHLNRLVKANGFNPPAPSKSIDLRKTAKQFKYPYHSLDYICREVGIGGKTKSAKHGLELWIRCMEGDPKAWREMERYNRGDVKITDELYAYFLPWIKGHPASDKALNGALVCRRCELPCLTRQGYATTLQGKFQRYQCSNCGAWSRSTSRLSGALTSDVAS